MTVPYYVNEHQSDLRAIKPGWYGLERNGKFSSGPFANQRNCLTGITQPRSNSRAWLSRHATHNPEVPPTRRATIKQPWTTWLMHKLLWTARTRRREWVGEPHSRAKSETTKATARSRGLPPGLSSIHQVCS